MDCWITLVPNDMIIPVLNVKQLMASFPESFENSFPIYVFTKQL